MTFVQPERVLLLHRNNDKNAFQSNAHLPHAIEVQTLKIDLEMFLTLV